jgi:hypothetical protein
LDAGEATGYTWKCGQRGLETTNEAVIIGPDGGLEDEYKNTWGLKFDKSFSANEERLYAFSVYSNYAEGLVILFSKAGNDQDVGLVPGPICPGETPTTSVTPSLSPTISVLPTLTPTESPVPTPSPSLAPSKLPSLRPSVSTEPTVSNVPSITHVPSASPSHSHEPSITLFPTSSPSISSAPTVSRSPTDFPSREEDVSNDG